MLSSIFAIAVVGLFSTVNIKEADTESVERPSFEPTQFVLDNANFEYENEAESELFGDDDFELADPIFDDAGDAEPDDPMGGAEGGVAFANEVIYMVFTANTSIPGVGTVTNEDIVTYTPSTGLWALYFDGSDVGLSAFAIDGFAIKPGSADLYFSFKDACSIPGLTGGPSGNSFDDSDIVRFTPTSLGATTSGTFAFYFDGSDIGLQTDYEDVDAIAFTPEGDLLISTLGGFSGGSTTGADEDLHRYTGTVGTLTQGILSIYFDGGDVELTAASVENVDGAAVFPDGQMLINTTSNFCVAGIVGYDPDVLLFTPVLLGDITIGFWTLYLENTEIGLSNSARIAALEVYVP